MALALDHSAGDQQQSSILGQGNGRSVTGNVGEESKRQAGRTEFSDPAAVAQKSGRVSGVGVAESAEFLVIAADECGARVYTLGVFDEAAVDP
jgi:hypothetical protein